MSFSRTIPLSDHNNFIVQESTDIIEMNILLTFSAFESNNIGQYRNVVASSIKQKRDAAAATTTVGAAVLRL